MKTVLQLIKDECANYDATFNGIKNHCWMHFDCQCIYYKDDTVRCPYFERNVLSLDRQIEAVYWAWLQAQNENRELSVKEIKEIKQRYKSKEKQTRISSKFKQRFGSK